MITASPAYIARLPRGVTVAGNERALGILQGRGVQAPHVTPGRIARAERDYQRRLKAETERRVRLGIPLTGSCPEPGQAPVVRFKPPWEK